jgi:hypothetical protein
MNHHFDFITKFIEKQLLDSLWANDFFKGENFSTWWPKIKLEIVVFKL